jgi:hypothetical protein
MTWCLIKQSAIVTFTVACLCEKQVLYASGLANDAVCIAGKTLYTEFNRPGHFVYIHFA